ncbi:MAG: T9SS type A sorting domain-containing protein [Crocinitomicaceae bacterium]|nr:T9SS type A sorting domain-containing protein [Crocinitomicaceae bacterium]
MNKKLTLLTFMMISLWANTQTRITNNAAVGIAGGNSVTCNAGGIISTDNSFFHIYDLENYTNIVDTAFIVRMKVGCEETSGGAYNIVGKVHHITGAASYANCVLIADDTTAIFPDSTLYRINIPFNDNYIYVLPNDSLACELHLPANLTASFYPGSNTSPESSPTYIMANGCTIPDMVTVSSIGFASMHVIMNLYVNQRPILADMTPSIFKDDSVYFSAAEIDNIWTDNDNDGFTMIKVSSLPTNGILDLAGTTLVLGDTVLSTEIDQLYYIPNAGYSGSDNFSFIGRDSSHWSLAPSNVDVTVINWQVGIEENNVQPVVVYPNPASKMITVSADGVIEYVRIFNTEGKLVYSKVSEENTIDISSFENGTYFIEIKTDQNTITNRFIKQ